MKSNIKFSSLVKAEQSLITSSSFPNDTHLIGVALNIGKDYQVYVEVDDQPESRVPIESVTDLTRYLEAISHVVGDIAIPELNRMTDILEFLDSEGRPPIKIDRSITLYLTADYVNRLLSGEKALRLDLFTIGVECGLRFYVETADHIEVRLKDIVVNLTIYDKILRQMITKYSQSQPSEQSLLDRLKLRTPYKDDIHPCLYGAFKFTVLLRRFPRKAGHDKHDETKMWEFIEKRYAKSPTKPNSASILFNGKTYDLDGMWKQYGETFAKHLIDEVQSVAG
ncbi:hypothetical protein [Alteromonas sp. CYL-A6]|uniref:hypothetical protein n=1 Tax=Alteromonas nitratireducens TaxID=3390813 RepID=UPI0034AECF6A